MIYRGNGVEQCNVTEKALINICKSSENNTALMQKAE